VPTFWSLLLANDLMTMSGMIQHLLWTLMFPNLCCKEQQLCDMPGGLRRKCFGNRRDKTNDNMGSSKLQPPLKQQWRVLLFLLCDLVCCHSHTLIQIIFENRFKSRKGCACLMSLNWTHFCASKHESEISSQKCAKKSALRCEVVFCILTGVNVWINSPHECHMLPNISVFRDSLLSHLVPDE